MKAMGIMECLMNGYDNKDMKEIVDLLFGNIEEIGEKQLKAITYAYLKVSVMTGVSLEEAFERYAWKEECKDGGYKIDGNRVLVAPCVEYNIYLVPRKNPLSCRLAYREMAYNLLEIVRKEFRLPKDENYGI